MPYLHTLSSYVLPEFDRPAPEAWERRLRELSPVTEHMAHLVFRWREPGDGTREWIDPHHGVWEIYSATPKRMVSAERAEQFRLHWSELPPSQQMGRRTYVTNYQHYMWHTCGVEVRRFWVLQGPWGGTPAEYTPLERRALDGEGLPSIAPPLGTYPPCPFDERSVKAIAERDRFYQAGKNIERLLGMDRPAALKAADDIAEREFRKKFTAYVRDAMLPQAEFITSLSRTTAGDQVLPKASRDYASMAAMYQDYFIERGEMPGGAMVRHRALQVAVPGATRA